MNEGKVLRLLGLARKAGRLRIGLRDSLETANPCLLVVSSDAGENVLRNVRRVREAKGTRVLTLSCGKDVFGKAVGRAPCAAAAVTDTGFCAAILSAADSNPSQQEGS